MPSEIPNGKKPNPRYASYAIQVQAFRRDGWLCRWCACPVIFAPTFKYLAEFAKQEGFNGPLAYYNRNWRRRDSPLLDHMGAVIDHVQAHSGEGPSVISNLVTACNKCNGRKSNLPADVFRRRSPLRLVRGKYGEPEHWDGLSTLFMLLIAKNPGITTQSERTWFRALKNSN